MDKVALWQSFLISELNSIPKQGNGQKTVALANSPATGN